jgi:hypothetical protein
LNSGIQATSCALSTLRRSKIEKGLKTMFANLMKAFDRASLTYFLALAITPMLALAAFGAVH